MTVRSPAPAKHRLGAIMRGTFSHDPLNMQHNVNVGPDLNLVIEFDDMGVVHTKAPVRDGATDRTRSMGAVDPIQRIAKI